MYARAIRLGVNSVPLQQGMLEGARELRRWHIFYVLSFIYFPMVPSSFFVHFWLFLGRRCSIGDAFLHVVVGISSSSLLLVGCEDGRSCDRGVHPTFVLPCPTSACWSSTLSPWVGFPTLSSSCARVGVSNTLLVSLGLEGMDFKPHIRSTPVSHTVFVPGWPKTTGGTQSPTPRTATVATTSAAWETRGTVAIRRRIGNPRRRQEDMLVKRKPSH